MSLNASLGTGFVALGFAGSAVGVATLGVGLVRGRTSLLRLGRTYAWVALVGALGAFVVMERALLGHDFSLRYVAEHGSRAVPTLYTFASTTSPTFNSDRIIVRHTEEYRTEESQKAEATEQERCDR